MDEGDVEGSGSLDSDSKVAASSMKILESTAMSSTPNEPSSTTPVAPSATRSGSQAATKANLENAGIKRAATTTIGGIASLMGNTMEPRPTSVSELLSQTQVLSTAVRCTATHEIPSMPNTTQKSGSMRVETRNILKIPIDVDGMKDVDVIGLNDQAPNWEEWVLKMNGKFVNVQNGKVVLSDTPNTINVTFHGKNERIVRLSLPGHGFLTIPANNPCLVTSQEAKEQGQLFVITKHGPNQATIETIAHMNLNSVPKDWSIAKEKELDAMEEFEELFQEELLALPDEELDEEERVKNMQYSNLLFNITISFCSFVDSFIDLDFLFVFLIKIQSILTSNRNKEVSFSARKQCYFRVNVSICQVLPKMLLIS